MSRPAGSPRPTTTTGAGIALLVTAVVLGLGGYLALTKHRPDPEGVVRKKLLSSAGTLAADAQKKLTSQDKPEDARSAYAQAHSEVATSRVIAPDMVEWDLIVAGGAADKYITLGGAGRKFHTCYRLSGRTGRPGPITRTDLPCPDAVTAPDRNLAKSTLLHLPNSAG